MEETPEIARLLKACGEFRAGTRTLEELQGAIDLCAHMILDPARNKLRDFLLGSDGELETLRFTRQNPREDALRVVDEIEKKLNCG